MTPQESGIGSLERFGYTERQASFLYSAAVHGGYFIGRQYDDYCRSVRGGPRQRLVHQLITNRHVTLLTSRDQVVVYHLSAKRFYAVIGVPDSRNRRVHPPFAVRTKLMTLDFVLGHPEAQFLASEQERVSFFSGTLGLPETVLPVKYYASKSRQSRNARYFVDRNPVYLSAAPAGAAPAVGFAYVDAGSETTAGFKSYLAQYRRLFQALDRFRLTYVASRGTHFAAAAREFRKLATSGTDIGRLIEHFEARQRHELGDYSGFTTETIERLRRELQEFSGARYDALFRVFQRGGQPALLGQLGQAQGNQSARFGGAFDTVLLEHSYDFMGPVWAE
jgi:hypothetical protein